MRHSIDRSSADSWMRRKYELHLRGVHIFATGNDEIFLAIDDSHEALTCRLRDVAGPKPSVREVADICIFIPSTEVSTKHAQSTHDNLTAAFSAVVIGDRDDVGVGVVVVQAEQTHVNARKRTA